MTGATASHEARYPPFEAGCSRDGNTIAVGETTGRGRDDQRHARHGARPKRVWVYPLARNAVARLRGRR